MAIVQNQIKPYHIKDGAYYCYCAYISAHLEIFGFPMSGACSDRYIFARFKTMRRKQNLASALEIQREKSAIHTFVI